MIVDGARVIGVILIEKDDNQDYFTTQGLYIGSLEAGKPVVKVQGPIKVKPDGGIVRSPSPEKVKQEINREFTEETGVDISTPDTTKLAKEAVRNG